MTTAIALVKFIALLMPELRELAIKLYKRHSGNVTAARAELRHIGDHGQQLKNFEAEIARRMADLKEKSARREAQAPTNVIEPSPEPKP